VDTPRAALQNVVGCDLHRLGKMKKKSVSLLALY
jgi:hypothetical protein